ncbi:hypothetical protein PMI16_03425 [Herbaspirillum sp. CF444]|uniref:hypothetical protein n=1 Tax=Herbaspirillum sp. CF444 TaxID=1144319 RepID=UPI0002727ECD|nr:hypothetical protein [Herbaspirillum sp. CF444]EJL85645.1 hypothetical protein PMI16_03425 [Herbaspirillum sp. CF444]
MAKTVVEIIHIVPLSGVGKKSGNAYDMRFAQCIVHQPNKDTGVIEPIVGELLLPNQFKDLPKGTYEVDFRLSVSQQKRIESVVDTITPYVPKAAPKEPAKATA